MRSLFRGLAVVWIVFLAGYLIAYAGPNCWRDWRQERAEARARREEHEREREAERQRVVRERREALVAELSRQADGPAELVPRARGQRLRVDIPAAGHGWSKAIGVHGDGDDFAFWYPTGAPITVQVIEDKDRDGLLDPGEVVQECPPQEVKPIETYLFHSALDHYYWRFRSRGSAPLAGEMVPPR